jgi:DNA-binding NarL/FixJ family response regulator
MTATWQTAPPWTEEEIPLTPRQVEVLECYARGLDSLGAARELGVSTSTIKNHVTQIFDRLSLERRCRIAALIQAWRRGEVVLFSTESLKEKPT